MSVQVKTTSDGKMELKLPNNNYNLGKIIISNSKSSGTNSISNGSDNIEDNNNVNKNQNENSNYFQWKNKSGDQSQSQSQPYDNEFFDQQYLFKPTRSILPSTSLAIGRKYPYANNGYESYIETPDSELIPKTRERMLLDNLSKEELKNLLLLKEQLDLEESRKDKKEKKKKHSKDKDKKDKKK